jgi:steroid delta-isomerase-like uncharacterized protein
MSVEENKALVRRFYAEVWERGHLEVAHEVFAEDYVRHELRPGEALRGPAGQAKIAEDFRRAFPDLRFEVELVLGDSDLVAARWTAQGTHTGPWGTIEPSGRPMRFSGVNIFRFADRKVVEIWNHRDDLGLMTQLGVPVFAGSAEPMEKSGTHGHTSNNADG